MVYTLVKNWWAVALVGVLAVILGIYSFASPGIAAEWETFCRAAFTGHSGESRKHWRLFANLGKDRCLGIARDVMSDHELAEGARALRVHPPLRNHLSIEMRKLFKEPDVLQQHGTARTGGHGILVFGYRRTGNGSQLGFISHMKLLERAVRTYFLPANRRYEGHHRN